MKANDGEPRGGKYTKGVRDRENNSNGRRLNGCKYNDNNTNSESYIIHSFIHSKQPPSKLISDELEPFSPTSPMYYSGRSKTPVAKCSAVYVHSPVH